VEVLKSTLRNNEFISPRKPKFSP